VKPTNGKPEPDLREYDFDVIYAPPKRWLSGLSFRGRIGLVQQTGTSGLLPDSPRTTPNAAVATARRLRWLGPATGGWAAPRPRARAPPGDPTRQFED